MFPDQSRAMTDDAAEAARVVRKERRVFMAGEVGVGKNAFIQSTLARQGVSPSLPTQFARRSNPATTTKTVRPISAPPLVAEATALKNAWAGIYAASEASSGAKTTTQEGKRLARENLQLMLFLNLLKVAEMFPRQPEKLPLYMQQHLLENLQEQEEEPAPPPPPGP